MQKLSVFMLSGLLCTCVTSASANTALSINSVSEAADNHNAVCLILNKSIEKSPLVGEIKNYLKIFDGDNEVNYTQSVLANQICLYNLKNGHNYKAVLSPNFISDDGSKNTQSLIQEFKTPDAKSSISLTQGSVLLNSNVNNLNLTTCNLDDFDLHLYKLSKFDLHDNQLYAYIQNNNLDNYATLKLINNNAAFLGSKNIKISDKRNEEVQTPINLKELGDRENDGIYLLAVTKSDCDLNADNFNQDDLYLSRVILISDVGITAYRGSDGLTVALRSIKRATPLKGAEVKLLAQNNEVLASDTSDKYGYLHFKKELLEGTGGNTPMALLVQNDKDSMVLDLRQDKLYIEDQGRLPSNSLYEIFAYVDRDLLSPGDTLNFNALLRDKSLKAVNAKSLILELKNPYGAVIERESLDNLGAGAFSSSLEFDKSLPEGIYNLTLSLDGHHILYSKDISLFKFKPQSFSIDVINPPLSFTPGIETSLNLAYTFNYGAPVSGAQTYGYMRSTPDNYPFEDIADFYFGPDTSINQDLETSTFNNFISDKNGETKLAVTLKDCPYAQNVYFDINVDDGLGNNNHRSLNYKAKASNNIVGVKRLNDSSFALTQRSPEGNFVKGKVAYHLYKLRTTWQYAFENGSWRYSPVEIKLPLQNGEIMLEHEDLASEALKLNLEDGSYCLELDNAVSKTSLRFYKGYFDPQKANAPERFTISLDKKIYHYGDKARLSFEMPFDCYADMTLGTKGIGSITHHKLNRGHNDIYINISDDMGSGVHALISAYIPENTTTNTPPLRTVGLSYIPIEIADSEIKLEAQIPDEIKPNTTLEIPLTFEGGQGKTFYTAALVDEGILGLTDFKAPDPLKTLNENKLFSLDIYDLYGYLMQVSALKQGYGADAMELKGNRAHADSLSLRDKLITLYQGVTEVVDGKSVLKFNLPERQSGAKLMIVAWNDTALGAFASDLKIHDSTVVSGNIPLYAKEGEVFKSSLTLQRLIKGENNYNIEILCEGALKCQLQQDLKLKEQNERQSVNFEIHALNSGAGQVKVKAMSSDYTYEDSFAVEVLKPTPQVLSFNYNDHNQALNAANFISISENQSPVPDIISETLLYKTLADEIHSSSEAYYALNTLLTIIECDDALYSKEQKRIDKKVNYALRLLIALTDPQGYLHDIYDSRLSLNVAYLMRRAVALGYKVSNDELKRGNYIINSLSQGYDNNLAALALKYRALNGENVLAQTRYLFDAQSEPNVEALAHLAKTFKLLGDEERAHKAILKGIEQLQKHERLSKDANVNENMLARISKSPTLDSLSLIAAFLDLDSIDKLPRYLKHKLNLGVMGMQSPQSIALYLELAKSMHMQNGNYSSLISYGEPNPALHRSSNIAFERHYLNAEGKAVKWSELKAGEIITVIEKINFKGKVPSDLVKISQIPSNLEFMQILYASQKLGNLNTPIMSTTSDRGVRSEQYRYFDKQITSAYRYRVLYSGNFYEGKTIIYDYNDPKAVSCD